MPGGRPFALLLLGVAAGVLSSLAGAFFPLPPLGVPFSFLTTYKTKKQITIYVAEIKIFASYFLGTSTEIFVKNNYINVV